MVGDSPNDPRGGSVLIFNSKSERGNKMSTATSTYDQSQRAVGTVIKSAIGAPLKPKPTKLNGRFRLMAGVYIQNEPVLDEHDKPIKGPDGEPLLQEVQYKAKLQQGPGGSPIVAAPYCDIDSVEDLEAKYGREKFSRLHDATPQVVYKTNPIAQKVAEVGLNNMSAAQLKSLAEDVELDFPEGANKAQLVELLLAAGVTG